MEVLSRAEAKQQGLKQYYTAKVCIHGHLSSRFVSNANCVACRYAWEKDNPDKVRAKERNWLEANRPKGRQKALRYKASKLQAVPAWVDAVAIQALYDKASVLTEETGVRHQVDHIVPLSSPLVCGLHCEANLQILTAFANQSKSNRFWPGMF